MTFFIWQGGISDRPVEISTACFLDLQYSANNLHIFLAKRHFLLVEISTACSLDLKYPVVNLYFTMPNTSHTQGNKMTV